PEQNKHDNKDNRECERDWFLNYYIRFEMSKLQNEEEIILTQLLDQKITGTPKEFYEKFTTFVNQKHHEALCNYLKMCGLNNKETKEYIKRHTNFAKTNSHNVIRKEDINSQNKSKYLMPETKSSKINSILSKYFEERLKELEEPSTWTIRFSIFNESNNNINYSCKLIAEKDEIYQNVNHLKV
ncbi:14758_t:CDS:2, partial [Entrophospora sp. SA101]